jgi:hypothetical protein
LPWKENIHLETLVKAEEEPLHCVLWRLEAILLLYGIARDEISTQTRTRPDINSPHDALFLLDPGRDGLFRADDGRYSALLAA